MGPGRDYLLLVHSRTAQHRRLRRSVKKPAAAPHDAGTHDLHGEEVCCGRGPGGCRGAGRRSQSGSVVSHPAAAMERSWLLLVHTCMAAATDQDYVPRGFDVYNAELCSS
jgi:hypothetical protein